MTDYTKSVNFATKDALITGDPLKVVKGTEINTELDNLATSIATKFDKAGGTITGATSIAAALTSTSLLNLARGSIVQHATTMDLWALPNTLDGTGSAVTITAIINAPQAGARRVLYPITGTIITNGATFSVDGGANYTTLAGDSLEFEAVTASTYKVHIIQANGGSTVPVGTIISFAGTSPPTGFLTCPIAQTNISRTTYAALFAVIGTLWGAGDGSTTFGMPWFPADYVAGQANANVGTQTVGVVLAHVHDYVRIPAGSGTVAAGAVFGASFSTVQTTNQNPAGGSANLAAGARVLKCVKF